MAKNGIKKGMIIIFLANILNLTVSIIRNFILPRYLSMNSYAEIKTYQLFISYAGILAFGYVDGMYLKYGGVTKDNIDTKRFATELSTYRILQTIISILICLIGIIIKNIIVLLFGITIIALNVTDYLKTFYQATGEFSSYSKIMNISSIGLLISNLLLVFFIRTDDPIIYIISYIFIYYFIWIALEVKLNKPNYKAKNKIFSKEILTENVKTGFVLMCGLFLSNFMTGLDRWFIKFTMDNTAFALYSFAASMEGFLSYAVSPISITLYNYFCINNNAPNINKMKKYIILFSTFVVTAIFPIKFIIEHFLKKYTDAINVLIILFIGQIFYTIIKCLFINLCKAFKKQNLYLKRILIVALCGFILNCILYYFMRNMQAYAIGTAISSFIWLILCFIDFKEYKFDLKDTIYIAFCIVLFIVTCCKFSAIVGCIIYTIANLIISYILFRKEIQTLKQQIFSKIKNKKMIRRIN